MTTVKQDFNVLYKKVRKQQLEIARKILNENEWIVDFYNAMGSYSFTELIDPNVIEDGILIEREEFVDNDDERIKEMEDFMQEWDDIFSLSGDPICMVKDNFDQINESVNW